MLCTEYKSYNTILSHYCLFDFFFFFFLILVAIRESIIKLGSGRRIMDLFNLSNILEKEDF